MPVIMGVLSRTALCAVLALGVAEIVSAQAADASAAAKTVTAPSPERVTQIDVEGLKRILKPNGKPLLVNFWATWCEPCREEFPDLVKIDNEYRGKIDFVTVTLDDPDDMKTLVPKFLNEVKAEMPTYLLYTTDENAAIGYVSKDWSGNLPMTVLYNASGSKAYERNGKVRYETLKPEIERVLVNKDVSKIADNQILDLPLVRRKFTSEEGNAAALDDAAKGQYRLIRYGMASGFRPMEYGELLEKYSILIESQGCFGPFQGADFVHAYNRTMRSALLKRYGNEVLTDLPSFPTGEN